MAGASADFGWKKAVALTPDLSGGVINSAQLQESFTGRSAAW